MWPWGATPRPKSGAAAERARPPRAQEQLRGATPRPGQGACQEELPHVQGATAAQAQEGREELLHVQGQGGSLEEIPLLRGMEQQLRFAGAAMKR